MSSKTYCSFDIAFRVSVKYYINIYSWTCDNKTDKRQKTKDRKYSKRFYWTGLQVWYAVGIVGNVLSAIIWLQRRMLRNNSSAVYLATLSINDTLFLLLHILLDLDQAWPLLLSNTPFTRSSKHRASSTRYGN